MSYTVLFKETARKELYALPGKILKNVALAIDGLSINPRPPGVKKLKGKGENLWRIRIGDYRVIFLIDDAIRIVNIRKIGHRKEVYD
jgi:mRNA interferase RelE/StbE